VWPFSPRNATYDQVQYLTNLLERGLRFMARNFNEVIADLDSLTTAAADRITSQNTLITQLQEALANGDQRLAEALAQQAADHVEAMETVAERLRGIAADEDDVVPDTTPLPEVPEPVTEGPAVDEVTDTEPR
jgi:hypothetical protein